LPRAKSRGRGLGVVHIEDAGLPPSRERRRKSIVVPAKAGIQRLFTASRRFAAAYAHPSALIRT
jgi:hypothetical protein